MTLALEMNLLSSRGFIYKTGSLSIWYTLHCSGEGQEISQVRARHVGSLYNSSIWEAKAKR
jgi:hypothetical protein